MNFQKKRNKMWKKAKRIFFNQLFKYVLLLLFIHCHVQLFFDRMDCRFLCPWDFPRQEYWSGLPFLPPEDLPDPGIKPTSLASPEFAGRIFTTEPSGKPIQVLMSHDCVTGPAPGVRGKVVGKNQSGSQPHGAYNLVVEKDKEPHKCKVEMLVSIMKRGT